MSVLDSVVRKLIGLPRQGEWESSAGGRHYRRVWIFFTLLVSIAPLVILTAVNYHQYQDSLRSEMIAPVHEITSNGRRAAESFLADHQSALRYVVQSQDLGALCDTGNLKQVLRNLKGSFGGFVDLGLIGRDGRQCSYAGPYQLEGKDYSEQEWFYRASARGSYVSEVFTGFRKVPHFIIAVGHETDDGDPYLLRATIDTEKLQDRIRAVDPRLATDTFLINSAGILQTPSRFFGTSLDSFPLPVPDPSPFPQAVAELGEHGAGSYIMGYAPIEDSPFVLIALREGTSSKNWFDLRMKLLGFLALCVLIIVLLIMGTSAYLVRRIQALEVHRAKILHNIEYTNKLASIGRLAAGVAHEINNPMAIINEKAGLMKDLISLTDDFPRREQFLSCVSSIHTSVERCRTVTHRLLGFAKHMDVDVETIDLESLINEVLGFLEKDASFRKLAIDLQVDESVPMIESDMSQLQQVFVNIINNAFEAVDDGGRIDISVAPVGIDKAAVTIRDNGQGIPKETLEHIFEPFFSTKGKYGTGLGLSITHGIVEKLGGEISVNSQVGEGTEFRVTLPITRGT